MRDESYSFIWQPCVWTWTLVTVVPIPWGRQLEHMRRGPDTGSRYGAPHAGPPLRAERGKLLEKARPGQL